MNRRAPSDAEWLMAFHRGERPPRDRDRGNPSPSPDPRRSRSTSRLTGRSRADAAGYLWVREYDFPNEARPAPLWTVFDPDGRMLGLLETPRGLSVSEIGEDYILGVARDELGVESVQLWPLRRSGG